MNAEGGLVLNFLLCTMSYCCNKALFIGASDLKQKNKQLLLLSIDAPLLLHHKEFIILPVVADVLAR